MKGPVGPFFYSKILLSVTGVLELGPWSSVMMIYRGAILSTLVFYFLMSFLNIAEWTGRGLPVSSFMSMFAMVHIIAKFFNLVLRRHKLVRLIESMSRLSGEVSECPRSALVLTWYASRSNRMTVAYTTIMAVILSSRAVILCSAEAGNATPLRLIPDSFEFNFPVDVFMETFIMLPPMAIVIREHNLLMTFTMQISAQLKVLNDAIIGLSHFSYDQEEVRKHRLRQSIRIHGTIFRLVKEMNELFSPVLFLETVLSSTQCCLSGYSISQLNSTDPSLPTNILMLATTLLLPFIICWCGSQIKEESSRLYNAVYGCGWEDFKPKDRKDILIIMTVATRPMTLNFKNTFIMDLEKYSNILQASYSYFTMISTLIE